MRIAFKIFVVATLVHIGCGQKPKEDPSVLARVGEKTITVNDLKAKLAIHAKSPLMAARFLLPENRRALLDEMVRDAALVQEARRRGYDQDPLVLREMVNRMFQEEIDNKINNESISDSDIETYYHAHLDDYSRPDRVHLAQIVVKGKVKAVEVANEAKRLKPNDQEGFKQLVKKYSEEPSSREKDGELGPLERKSKDVPQEILDAAFTLPIGSVSDPIQVQGGFAILQIQQSQPGFKTTPEAIAVLKPSIQKRISNQRKLQNRSQLIADILKQTKVEIVESRLATIDFK